MMFFPKLLQGPIERAGHLLPQLRQTLQTNRECLTIGMHLLVWGFLKKVVVADTIAGYVDSIFGDVHAYPVLSHLAATYAYAIQVYFDFSGYTDMALGAARLFGLRLTQNFNQPYASASIGEFWRRWHISFSRWILDYIFTPLQMQWREWRVWGTSAALLVTFFLSGLWHGPSGGFIVWGLLHGTYLAGSALSARVRSRIRVRLGISNPTKHTLWRIFLTFNLVCLASMFFRAARVKDGIFMLANGITTLPAYLWEVHLGQRSIVGDLLLGRSGAEFASACLLIGFVFVVEWLERRQGGLAGRSSEFRWLRNLPFWAQGAIYGCAFYLVTLRGAAAKSFIYLQF
jgi:D-alanyl-lipoteichoic acid acyltransferase DltB (MBOAT superfamily)